MENHLSLKGAEGVKPSLHNRPVMASAKRARSARHAQREKAHNWYPPSPHPPLGIRAEGFLFLKKGVLRSWKILCSCACLVFHFSRVNETHSVSVWSFPGVVSSTNKSFTFMNSKAGRIIFKLRPGWILTKSSWQDRWLLFVFIVKQLTEDELEDP